MSEQPTPPTPDPAPVATPEDYKAKYEAEVQDRIRERNLFKPAQQLLNGLDEGARSALMELAELARAGDANAIAEWNLQVAAQVSGKDVAALIAERQAKEQGTAPLGGQTPTPGLTAEQIDEMVRQRTGEMLAADRSYQAGVSKVAAELAKAGFDYNSPAGETIVRYAVEANNNLGCDLPEAIKWYETAVEQTVMDRARKAAAAAAGVPEGAPQGSPVGKIEERKQGESDEDFRHRSIMAKLTSSPTN